MQIKNPYIQYMYSYPHKTAYRALENVDVRAFFNQLIGEKNSLYFHVPFCQYKCGYCNLFSLAGQSEQMMVDYVDAMERHAKQMSRVLPSGVEFEDLTIGGGTPLILSEDLLERIFRMAENYFAFYPKKGAVVVETSPNQTTASKLKLLKQYGTTRISIGVQSFHDDELKALSRFHTVATAKKALSLIKEESFSCVNIDLIYGIPGQTRESLLESVEQAIAFEPEELFVYPLYIKKGTGLYGRNENVTVGQTEKTYELYRFVREVLRERGYQPYSMRRFVKSAIMEQTSLCGFGNTISIGCGGRSYIGNLHFCTPYAVRQDNCLKLVKDYIERENHLQVDYGFLLNEDEQKRRYVIKHILFGMGICKEDYRQRFHSPVEVDFPQLIEWVQQGYADDQEKYIVLTETGFALSDYLGPQLISSKVAMRMKEWKEADGTEQAVVL